MNEAVSNNAIESRVEELRQAMLANDGEALDKLFASEMTWGHSNAHVESRAECLANLANKVFVFPTLVFSGFSYSEQNEVVVVRHRMDAETAHQNEAPGHVDISVVLVWVKEAGTWKLLVRQACKNP